MYIYIYICSAPLPPKGFPGAEVLSVGVRRPAAPCWGNGIA